MATEVFEGHQPSIANDVYIAKTALVIGDVSIGSGSSVWPGTIIRGDVNRITIGEKTNIQDGTICHVSHKGEYNPNGAPLKLGSGITIGHGAVLHGCEIHDFALVGIRATILDNAIIESDVMIGANSLVPPNKILASGYLYLGSPVKQARPLTEKEREFLRYSAEYYYQLQRKYRG